MASVWITTRATTDGGKRYRVEYRLGGRESQIRYGGSFKTRREATIRKGWIAGELTALRVPDLTLLTVEMPRAMLLSDACEQWRQSRIDVTAGIGALHRVALGRVLDTDIARRRLNEITVEDVVALVTELNSAGYKRETIKKSRDYLAMVLDHHDVDPNPTRDKRVKLPRERRAHVPPPLAEHVERITEVLSRRHVLPRSSWTNAGPV